MSITTSIRILVPEETVNYIKNPAIRQATTGWNASGSAISRGTAEARFGFSSLKVITTGAVNNEGTYYRVSSLDGVDSVATASAYVRGTGKIRIRLINSGGREWYSQPLDVTTTRWQRIEITGRVQDTDDVRVYLETEDDNAQGVTFYVDGVQLELHPHSTTYCDGEQDGCIWRGSFDNSASYRSIKTRMGGKWIDVAGPCRESDDIYVTVVSGAGMPPIGNQTQSYATIPGSFHQGSKVGDRLLTMTFHAKNKSEAGIKVLHELRQQLVDILKPDRTYKDQPFTIEYNDGQYPLYIHAYYDAGMDGGWDIRNKWFDAFPIRFIANDPFWYEDNQEITELDPSDSNGNNTIGIARKSAEDGSWSFIPIIDTSALIGVAQNPVNGDLYFLMDEKVIHWDGETATTIGTITAGSNPYDIAVDRNGRVYVCGSPLNVAGTNQRLAYYESGAWTGVATPGGGTDYFIAIITDVNGTLYGAGSFSNGWPFAKWDGTWNYPGAGAGASFDGNIAYNIQISSDKRYIYVSGRFTITHAGGTSRAGILKYDIENDTFLDEVGTFGAYVGLGSGTQLVVTDDNRIYSNDANPFANVLYFNGGTWTAIAFPTWSAANGTYPNAFFAYRGGFLSINTRSAGIANNPFLLYRSGIFAEMDFLTPNSTAATCVFVDKEGNIYIDAKTGEYGVMTQVDNTGSAFVEPKLYIKGKGTLNVLENFSQDTQLYFDLDILSNEEMVIDFSKRTIESNVRKNMTSFMNSISEFSEFILIPGTNNILLFIRATYNIESRISYVPRHWSVDAVNRGEEI